MSSTFNTSTLIAVGGKGGIGATTVTGAAGGIGSAVGNTAGTNYAGGTGATGTASSIGGGGAGGAGNAHVGGNGSGSTPGAGGGVGGATGGTGVSNATGNNGNSSAYGGGGGGTRSTGTGRKGGVGGSGAVLLSWTTGYCSAYCTSSTAPATYITNFSLTGGTTSINNTTTNTVGGHAVYPSTSASAIPGTTLSYSITMTGGSAGLALWVDWNQDNDFNDASEQIYNSNAYVASGTYSGTITIPSSQTAGTYWIRVRTDYNNSTVLNCSAELQAETEDYPLIVLAPPVPTITSLSSGSGCAGSSLTINGTNLTGATASNITIGGTAVSSITSNNGTALVVVIGSGTTGTVSVTTPGGTATYGTPFTVYPLPTATASYSSPVCAGSTLNLTGTTDIGTSFSWTGPNSFTSTSQNPSISNVTSAASGTYSFTATANGCSSTVSTANVTVNPIPTVVTASASSSSICPGSPVDLTSSATSNASSAVSFSEGFETFPPSGWTFINAGSGNSWVSSTTFHAGAKSISYDFNASTANAWGITSGIYLTSGTTYIITFWYEVFSASYPEKLKVTVGTLPTVVGQSTTLWDCNGGASLTNTSWAQGITAYTPTTSGTYYFGFNCYSAASMDHLYVDDVSISGGSVIPATYTWTSIPSGYTSSTQNPTGVLPSVNTQYIVTAQNFYGCTASNSTTVNIITIPSCATYTAPANGAPSAGLGSSLTWTAPGTGGTPTGYKLYFGTDNPPTNIVNGTNIGNVLTYSPTLSSNTTYYWKVVPTNCAGDGSCSTVWSFHTTTATTVTVPGSYATIRLAYDACTLAIPYIIEIQPSYAGETYPILFGSANAGQRSANNTIVIRPATGESWTFTNTGTETSIFEFNGATYVTIDGRQGGSGSSGITIENTQTASGKWAISMHGGSTYNTVKYCTIKGSNADATAASANAGVIRFADGTNSNNTIDNCTITKSGTNKPAVGILSYDGTNNNLLSITNNSFVDITKYGIWASGSNNTGWTISNNNFYQSAAVVPAPTGVMAAIQIDNGGGYTVSGNNIGGQAGGSSPYTVTGDGTSAFVGINFAGSTAATTNTVSSNTINDISISISAINAATPFCFTGINAAGSANFNIGGSGTANTIGDMSGITHKIVITSSSAITNGFSAINNTATGTSNITYNNIGSIDLSGISAACSNNVNIIRNSNASGTITIDHNTIGNTTADNMNMGGQTTSLIYNQASAATATFSVTNNTIQKIKYTGSGSFYGIYNNQCALTCTGNTISGINSTGSSASQYCIYHSISSKAATISSNIINTITTSSASSKFNVIYMNAATATSAISSNTIGTASANNISLAGNTEEYAIQIMDGGTVTCNANTLRNITLTSTGTSNVFWGLTVGSSSTKGAAVLNATNNTITDINTYSETNNTNESFSGIRLYSTGSGHIITNNTIQRLKSTGTSSGSCEINAIAIRYGVSGNISKNLITDITTSNTAANLHVICFDEGGETGGTWTFYNNAIVLNNTSNGFIEGLHFFAMGATGTNDVFYHNTIKLSGTASVSYVSSAFDLIADVGTYTVKNNVFQNLRSGAGSANYAIENSNPCAITEAHDYLESSSASTVGLYGGTDKTFAAWNTAVSSTGNISGNSTPVTLDAIGAPPQGAPLQNAGVILLTYVSDDRLGGGRPSTPYPGAYEPENDLPIELILFTAHKLENSVKLVWETATEMDNDYFTVERSLDGITFEPIAFVDGAGNSNSLLSYQAYDNDPFKGINYYRLKQTDFNGKFAYSNIIEVDFNNDNEEINIYPNPFSDRTTVYFSDADHLPFNIEIFDALGKIVREEKQITGNVFVVEKGQLKPGVYILRIYSDKQSIVKQVIVK